MTDDQPRLALDTNVLFYASDDTAGVKQVLARDIIARASTRGSCVVSVQSIGEFFHSITRKRVAIPGAAARRARDFLSLFSIAEPAAVDAATALDLAEAGRSSYWDGLLLATVARAGCGVLLSEDMQDGATIVGVTVRDPFAGETLPDTVAALLA